MLWEILDHRVIKIKELLMIKYNNHASPSSLLNELLTAAINLAFKLTLLSGLQKSVTHFILHFQVHVSTKMKCNQTLTVHHLIGNVFIKYEKNCLE